MRNLFVLTIASIVLFSFTGAYAQNPTPDADLNQDGTVDEGDLLLLLSQWHVGELYTPTPTETPFTPTPTLTPSATPTATVPDDHGNGPDTATLISTDGDPMGGVIEPPGDVDWFTFIAISGDLYEIKTFGLGPGSDTLIQLYGLDGSTLLAEDDNSGSEPGASRIVQTLEDFADYYVAVSQANGGSGSYSICVTDLTQYPPDDHGDGPGESTIINVGGTAIDGSNEQPGDKDWFSFYVSQMGVYQIQTSELGPGSDTILQLYGSDGTSKLAENDDSGLEPGESRISRFISPGLYYAVVFQKGSGVGTYKISVTR